jgi:hypothetical protein
MKAKEKLQDLQGLIAAIEAMPDGSTLGDLSQNSNVRMRGAEGPGLEEMLGGEATASVSEGEVAAALESMQG